MTFEPDWKRFCTEAASLTPEEVRELEAQLLVTPEDPVLRVQMVGATFTGGRSDAATRRLEHLAWLAEHRPDIDLGGYTFVPPTEMPSEYGRLRQLWAEAITRHADDVRVVAAAASFFSVSEPELSSALFERACELEPERSSWRHRLARARLRDADDATDETTRAEALRLAMHDLLEALHRAEDAVAKSRILVDIGWTALAREDRASAADAARRVIASADACRGTFQRGDALHSGHQLLGAVALAGGDLDGAARELLLSAATPGSPQLASFGPEMQLAGELLRAGRREDVAAYLEGCRAFWKTDDGALDDLLAALRRGETPELA